MRSSLRGSVEPPAIDWTASSSAADESAQGLKAAGGIYVVKDVVVDGNLMTSRWPLDLPAFVREIILALRKSTR